MKEKGRRQREIREERETDGGKKRARLSRRKQQNKQGAIDLAESRDKAEGWD